MSLAFIKTTGSAVCFQECCVPIKINVITCFSQKRGLCHFVFTALAVVGHSVTTSSLSVLDKNRL